MGNSPLDFINSDKFRKKLITRNLTPYAKSPNKPTPPTNYEYIQSDTSVLDSPDTLIDEPTFANKLYPLNQWGSEGGFKQVPDPNGLMNVHSNEGEYGYTDGKIIDEALPESQKWKSINAYSNGTDGILDSANFFNSIDLVGPNSQGIYNNQPYPTFNSSSYSPVSILLTPDPQGSNGLLSNDSFIARLGAQTLRRSFEERIATEIKRNTIGRANVFNVRSGTDVLNMVTGRVPLIEPNYTITVPSNPVLAATNFALRLAGSILPVSPIPGSYWDTNVQLGQPTTIQQMNNAFRRSTVGKFFNRLLGGSKTGSEIMYNNMGGGQKSRLFANIDFNRYKPSFDRTLFDRLGGAIVGSTTNNSNYYIGSTSSEPSRVFSPAGDIPVNSFGIEQQSPVYGPQELAQLYEGPSKEIRLGANGPTYSSGGGIEGGMTWVSPKYKDNAGKKVGIGGEITNSDEDFKPSSYNTTESTNFTFRDGSILDDTQRIIDSQPQGGKRLQHVGNAIDQVSKVFNDGYKELTKGSRVIKYSGSLGQEVGTEYCRVFAKDIPYLQYNDLQKTDGITTQGRRFSYSVLDNTYNLNIVPNKQEGGQDSTNLINGPGGTSTNIGYAKKYMFSLENLAWRTASTPGGAGSSVADLPICERGPNGGRVMWFPPYGLTFTENVSASWNSSEFLGRPEPIYTYKSTQRSGTLNWKIVVDHPSILNVIVNKVLSNETNNSRINSMIESFFAGCLKYDLYELAKKYWTINPNDLYQLQQAITSQEMTKEQMEFTKQTIQTGVNSPTGAGSTTAQATPLGSDYFSKYNQLGFYFANDFPKQGSVTGYDNQYTIYLGQKAEYDKKQETKNFFESTVTPSYDIGNKQLVEDLSKQLKQYPQGNVTIVLNASCSAPAKISYNLELAQRRVDSVKKFFLEHPNLKDFVKEGRLIVNQEKVLGEETRTTPTQYTSTGGNVSLPGTAGKPVACSDENPQAVGGDVTVGAKEIFTYGAMACRRTYIKSITSTLTQPQSTTPTPEPQYAEVVKGSVVTETVKTQKLEQRYVPRDNITKRVLRSLLSECDYFETIKQESPMVYDNLREKLKFFQPAFHSMTPEGLNSRLTFLQQCMRPGDTIPTIRDVGGAPVLQYNNATNTSFGAPPVLVLRVGDFFNTKIIPTSLNITYDDLDLNPEGIGVQPMIATISMGFNFVGGSGLKESIDKLQNALTFNYYANTEIYDDRADTTENPEFLKSLDKEFLAMAPPPGAPALNQSQPQTGQDNNSPIGVVTSISATTSGETGSINYRDFMVKVVNETQTYFTNVINKQKEVLAQYNNAMRQQWQMQRNYVGGNLSVDANKKTALFGKPSNIQKTTDEIFELLIKDVESGNEGFMVFIKDQNFSAKAQKVLKENYVNVLKKRKANYQNAITKIVQDMTTIQQSYIQTLARLNTITYDGVVNTGTDGYQNKKGNVVVYIISGTSAISPSSKNVVNTLEELVADAKTIQDNLIAFDIESSKEVTFTIPSDKNDFQGRLIYQIEPGYNKSTETISVDKTFIPFSKKKDFASPSFKRVYMILSMDVVDDKKYDTFKNEMIGNIKGNTKLVGNGDGGDVDIEAQFDKYWIGTAKPLFVEENGLTKSFIEHVEKNQLKNFVKFTPFDSKSREFKFSTENSANPNEKKSQENLIKGLGASTNLNTNQLTWCDNNGNASDVYISKAKLN